MKTIYVTKLIKEASTKKRKPSFLRLVKTRHKELKKQQVDNYKKRGWTFTIEHRGKYQYLYRQKTIDGHHIHVSMRANSWKDLNKKLWYRAEQEIRGEYWGGYLLTPSELDTYIWIMVIPRKEDELIQVHC